jgi:hypothetical protein
MIFDIVATRGRVLGRVDLQKTVYFAQYLGVPVPFQFRWRSYGPYSEELDHLTPFLVLDGVLGRDRGAFIQGEAPSAPTQLNDAARQRFEQLFDNFWEVVRKKRGCKGYKFPTFVECVASIHFLKTKLPAGPNVKERTFQRLSELKPNRRREFKPMIEDAWEVLERNGL